MKRVYRKILNILKLGIIKVEILKIFIFEIIAIYKKRDLYKGIKWTKEQQKEFDSYWIKNYGKKIPNYWHKLYQSINGKFNEKYIPEILYTTKFEYKLNNYYKAKVFEDKGFYDILFMKNSDDEIWRIPKTYLLRYNNIFYDGERNILTREKAENIIKNIKSCVIKPTIDTSSGEGVALLSSNDEIKKSFFSEKYKYSILQEKLSQSNDLKKLNSSSINTFRIMSYLCKDKIEISPIALRIGSKGSFLDNIHAGGIGITVNENGVLNKYGYILGWGDNKKIIKSHPDTKVIFEDYKIKNVENIIKTIKKLHSRIPEMGIISWDVTIDDKEIPVIIEANLLGQGSWFPQMISGKSLFDGNEETMLKNLK